MKDPPKHIGYYDTESEAIRLCEAMKKRLKLEHDLNLKTEGENNASNSS